MGLGKNDSQADFANHAALINAPAGNYGEGQGGSGSLQSDDTDQGEIIVLADRGKRKVTHTQYQGFTEEQLDRLMKDPNVPPSEKLKIKATQKGLKLRNKQKRGGKTLMVTAPLVVMCILAPVTCGLVDTDGDGVISNRELLGL